MKQWAEPVSYKSDAEQQAAGIVYKLIVAVGLTYLIAVLLGIYYHDVSVIVTLSVGITILIVPYILLKVGQVSFASITLTMLVIGTLTVNAMGGQGINDLSILAFPIIYFFTSVSLNRSVFRISIGFTLLAIFWLTFGDINGLYVPKPFPPTRWGDFLMIVIVLGAAAFTSDLLATNLRKNFERAEQEITERKQAEKEISRALLNAKQANEVKDQFIANISHEIRTPLNSIIGFSDIFQKRYSDVISEKDQNLFDYINSSSQRLMQTVDSILNIAQLNAGAIKIQKTELDLVSITKAVVEELKPQANEKNLELKFIAPKLEFLVFADNYCIQQALNNITENAIKYTFEGQVVLKLHQDKGRSKLSITDSGIGISEEYQSRIFQAYTQESEGYTKKFQGVGLGLALTKRYLDLNGVELDLESQKDVGTTFTLTFPIYDGNDHA
ncbi:MAG: HAMP domain-containing histidine kinase [FCB group bacterium]|nr:HAMP domain-containing histidine kinase [FCB group bacterium]